MKLESDGGEDELSQWLHKISQDAKQSVLGSWADLQPCRNAEVSALDGRL